MKFPVLRMFACCFCISFAAFSLSAYADIKVGVTISTTGPAAAIGIPSKNAMLLWPKEIAGQRVEYVILDDASDATNAVRNARKLTAEEKVDVIDFFFRGQLARI